MPTAALTTYACPYCRTSLAQNTDNYLCRTCGNCYAIKPWGINFLPETGIGQASQAEMKARNREVLEYEREQIRLKGDSFIRLQGQLICNGLANCPEGPVLDAACGTGLVTQALTATGRRIVAADMSEASLEVLAAKNVPNTDVVQADITHLPFASGVFAAITASLVLQHMDADLRGNALREFARCLAPGGKVIATAYARVHFRARKRPEEGVYESGIPYFSFTHGELKQLAEVAGFKEIVVRPLGLFLHLRAYPGGWRVYFNFHRPFNGFETLIHSRLGANRNYRTDYWILEARKSN